MSSKNLRRPAGRTSLSRLNLQRKLQDYGKSYLADKALDHKQFAVVTFLDIEGASNNMNSEAIGSSLNTIGVKYLSLVTYLELISTTTISVKRGCYLASAMASRGKQHSYNL